MYLVTADEMQIMDRETIETFGIPGQVLMENAGRGATRMLLDKFPGVMGSRVGVLAGRGNNGGDGFVIARYLAQYGVRVCVYLLSEKSKVKGDAEANLKLLEPLHVPVFEVPDEAAFERQLTGIKHQDIWVDAILGTGLSSPVRGYFKEVIKFVNQSNRPVFAVDIPSGLDSDTGKPLGISIKAHATATFGFAKIGHVLYPGKDNTGDLGIIDIGIPPHIVENIGPGQTLLTPDYIYKEYQPRPADAHKGTTGHLLIVAGSIGKTGAAAMAAISAVRAGAGLVTLGIPAGLNSILESQVLEAMTIPLDETDGGYFSVSCCDEILSLLGDKRCLAIGPGIGVNLSTEEVIVRVVSASSVPVVIDADGLNILAENMGILKKVRVPVILTPHPGEMARLTGLTPKQVQENRVSLAIKFAQEHDVHLVLKGAGTVIAHPDGSLFINPTGNSGMASGGMGDVLTGLISGFLVQGGYSLKTAIHMGVFLHGAAADALGRTKGPQGYLASEVMHEIPSQIHGLIEGKTVHEINCKMPSFLGL